MTSESDLSSSEDEKKAESSETSSSNSDASDSEDDKPTKPTPSKKVVASDSESEHSDVEGPTHGRKRTKTHKVSTASKRPRNDSDDDDRRNRGLFETEEEYERWRNMNEKEREQEIFDRMEKADMLKARAEIEKKLAKKKDVKKGASDGSDDDASASQPKQQDLFGGDSDSDAGPDFHKPSEVFKKKKQKNAMADLLNKRNDKKKKEEKKAALSIDAVFGKDESDSDSSSSESSSNSSRSSSSSRESSPERRESEDEQTKAKKKPIDCIADLSRARLSRYKISLFVHAPFFAQTAVGAFVRIQTGPIPGSKARYRIGKVLSVEETAKVYSVENTRTNKGFKIKFGKHERVYRLEYISNSEFNSDEFEEWKTTTVNDDSLPTMEQVRKKQKDIADAVSHTYTDKEVEAMIKEKGRFQQTPRNFAMTKGELIKKKEVAEQNGDSREVQRIQRELEELEQKADRLDKARSADISGITWINRRNREKMKEQFLADDFKIEMTTQDDPFTRKNERMKVVCGTSKLAGASTARSTPPVVATTPVVKVATPTPISGSTSKMHSSKSASNLFELHNSINNFDIDFDKLPPPREQAVPRTDTYASSSNTASSGRNLSIADYRKRKAQGANSSQ